MTSTSTAVAVARQGTRLRPEIQALRALAVSAVVVGHVWPRLAPAGFLGVDVFFVISGFLITGHLVRERERTGRIDLIRFYVRRARRLLPAAVVVLAVSAVTTLVFVPRELRQQYLGEIASSVLYVQNWFLAIAAGDPARAGLESSPVVHFWSLSVEEQFYLFWPLLVIGAFAVAARLARRTGGARGSVAAALMAVTVISFVYSVLQTQWNSDVAYYSTFSRAWEFGVGGLLALLPAGALALSPRQRSVLSWLGLAVIIGSVVAWNDEGAFPGWTALVPVAGAAAVIVAGEPDVRWSPLPLARLRPVQWLGDASYSLYLWHWPIIAFLPFITGMPTEWYVLVPVLALALLVSGLSLRFIENPLRFGSGRATARRRILIGGYSAIGVATAAVSVALAI